MDRFFYVVNQGWHFYWRSTGRVFTTKTVGWFEKKQEAEECLKRYKGDLAYADELVYGDLWNE